MNQSRSAETSLPLTARQHEVARLIAQRYSQKEISQRLVISETTVQRHVTAIKQRLGVNSLREIATVLRAEEESGGWEIPTVQKNDMAQTLPPWPNPLLDEPYVLTEREVGAMNYLPSVFVPEPPRVVPRLLDGKYRVPLRLAIIGGMILAGLSAIVLTVAAIQSISELVRGSPPDRALEQEHKP